MFILYQLFFNIFKMEYIRNRITEGNYKTTVIKPDLWQNYNTFQKSKCLVRSSHYNTFLMIKQSSIHQLNFLIIISLSPKPLNHF